VNQFTFGLLTFSPSLKAAFDRILLRGIFDVLAVGVGDGGGCVCVFGGWALVFLGTAGDRFVATNFGLCFLLFVTLVFFLALQECRCQGLLESAGANPEKIGSLFSSIMAEAEP
jgi:hypothetical protein